LPSNVRAGRTLRVLPNGSVFLTGHDPQETGTDPDTNDIYDVAKGSWSTTAPQAFRSTSMTWAPTALGDLAMVGANKTQGAGAETRVERFDPIAPNAIPPIAYDPGSNGRNFPAWSLVGTGRLFVTGGDAGGGNPIVLGNIHADAFFFSDGAFDGARATIDSAPSTAAGGDTITLQGQRLDTRNQESPLAFWTPDNGEIVLPMTVTSFGSSIVNVLVPATVYAGPGWLHVVNGGIATNSVPLAIAPSNNGVACRYDAECATGVCADGFCCNRTCDKACEACSARRKGLNGGPDGACGAVTPGKDPDGKCFVEQGGNCDDTAACDQAKKLTCSSGRCCDSPCNTDPCLSCAVQGKEGTCTLIDKCNSTCDGDHTIVQAGQPPQDCAPFRCDGTSCRSTCASVNDCVDGAVCTQDGVCAAPPHVAGSSETFFGCTMGRSTRDGGFAIVLALLALLRRRACRT
jgi:hypothetical protein